MYTTRQVADLLELPAWQVREYARAGFLSPCRTDRGFYRFAFTDLVLLRTAAHLAAADEMTHRRVQRTLGRLRAQLGAGRSLTELGIAATGDGVLVQDGPAVWNAETGQCYLNFAEPAAESDAPAVAVAEAPGAPATPAAPAIPLGRAEVVAQGWFELGCDQEAEQPDQAIESYLRAVSINPDHADAHVNLGRMYQARRRVKPAMEHYEAALRIAPYHATAAFNLAMVYQKTNRATQAIEMFERTVDLDPNMADAHYHLARLYETDGRARDALRHFQIYKKLTGSFRPRRPRR